MASNEAEQADKPRRRPALRAELLRRTFGVDALHCPLCGGRRELIALITQPHTAQRILETMGLLADPPAAGPTADDLLWSPSAVSATQLRVDPMRSHPILTALVLGPALCAQSASWTSAPTSGLPGDTFADAAFDQTSSAPLVISTAGFVEGAVYELRSGSWVQIRPRPSSTVTASIAWDSTRNRTVAVTVDNNAPPGFLSWVRQGSAWVPLAPRTTMGFYAREVKLAYDSLRDRLILHACATGSTYATQTWEFDGSQWLFLSSGGPTPRLEFSMAFDRRRGRTVLFGGRSGGQPNGELWEWDGVLWRQVLGLNPTPGAREAASMAWHDGIGRIVLFGGAVNVSTYPHDVWTFDGTAWTQVQVTGSVALSSRAGMCYDPGGDRLILTAGGAAANYFLAFQNPVAGTFSTFGAGCPGAGGTPALTAAPGSLPYINSVFSLQLTGMANTLFNQPFGIIGSSDNTWQSFMLPMSLTPFGFTGCTGYVSVDIVTPLANVGGTAQWPISIPNDLTLVGGNFYVQALVLEPGTNPGGAIVSNAGAGVVGLR